MNAIIVEWYTLGTIIVIIHRFIVAQMLQDWRLAFSPSIKPC